MAPASVAYTNEKVIAIMDIQPANLGHVLVIPKKHAANLAELDEETGAHMFQIAMRIAEAMRRSGVRCDGINIFLADGKAASQDVFHVHLHIIPRFFGDGFRIEVNYGSKPSREELDKIARRIRKAMEN